MELKKITAVVLRSINDSVHKVAIVTADCDPDMVEDADDLLGAISAAVYHWVASGVDKTVTVKAHNGEFNIGDLASHGVSTELAICLNGWGVNNLTIETYISDRTTWDYDDNLYDPNAPE
jgi:hypothetical protein